MKAFALTLVGFYFFMQAMAIASVPELTGPIVDQENIFSDKLQMQLEQSIVNFKNTTGIQLQVLTISDFGGLSVEQFSLNVAEGWGIGKKGDDRGVLFIVSKKQHALRFEVGTGLEGDLPDITMGRIVQQLIPYFRNNQFQEGMIVGLQLVANKLGTPLDLKDIERQTKNVKRRSGAGTLLFLLIMLSLFGRSFLPFGALILSGSGRSRHYGSWGGSTGGWSSGRGSWSGGGGGFSGGGASGHW